MPKCTADEMRSGRLGRQVIEANFAGGALSSDGGLMLLRQVDRKIGLSKAVANALHDPRNPDLIVHELRDLVAQRLYGPRSLLGHPTSSGRQNTALEGPVKYPG